MDGHRTYTVFSVAVVITSPLVVFACVLGALQNAGWTILPFLAWLALMSTWGYHHGKQPRGGRSR